MDFWEGAFLGPWWIQSDYQDRSHVGFHLLLGFIAGTSAILALFTRPLHFLLPLPTLLYLLMGLLFLFALPFFAARYPSRPLPIKILILLAYGLQYFCAWAFPVKLLFERGGGQSGDLLGTFGEVGNTLLDRLAEFFSYLGGITATLASVVFSALTVGVALLAFLLLLIYLPLLYFYLIKRLQRMIDYFVIRRFYPERIQF
ncbi:MAG: hypothetical protein MSC43_06420 [Clostridiales bacterium]|nr:hypothetical protein [Clostridiales bacterium]MDD7433176.1 hypothetical protein [Clostridiales bacterium]MDY3061678.1 hypothetical protein [Eubacteriales bacterium]